MHSLFGTALIGLICFSFTVSGADRPEQPIELLIRQLGDSNFRVRERAGTAIAARGEEALPALRKAVRDADPEIHRRVEVLTARIERQVLLSAKRVTLEGNLSVYDAVNSIAKQTGYKIQIQGQTTEKGTYKLKDVPFWEAMHQVLTDGGMHLNWDANEDRLTLSPNDTYNPYVNCSGPFYICAQNIGYSKNINLGNLQRRGRLEDNVSDNLSLSLTIVSEPKAPILSIGQPRVLKAEDEDGRSLAIPVTNTDYVANYYDGGGYRNFQFSTSVSLVKPNRDAQKIKTLKVVLPVTLLARIEPEIVIEKVIETKNKKAVGKTLELTFEKIETVQGIHQVTVLIQRIGNFDQNDNSWMNTVPQKLELQDEKGNKFISHGASSVTNSTPTSIAATYQFGEQPNIQGKPFKFLVQQWHAVEHEVEFELRNVPLP